MIEAIIGQKNLPWLPELAVKIARPTLRKLELAEGMGVFLVIKARACHVISK